MGLTVVVVLGDAVRVQGMVEVIDRTAQQVLWGIAHQLCHPETHTGNEIIHLNLLNFNVPFSTCVLLCTSKSVRSDLKIKRRGGQAIRNQSRSHSGL